MEWLERCHWTCPVSPDSIVEIASKDLTNPKIGRASEFYWGWDSDPECRIWFYRVLVSFRQSISEVKAVTTYAKVPDNCVLLDLESQQSASEFMKWWGSKGYKNFFDWKKEEVDQDSPDLEN